MNTFTEHCCLAISTVNSTINRPTRCIETDGAWGYIKTATWLPWMHQLAQQRERKRELGNFWRCYLECCSPKNKIGMLVYVEWSWIDRFIPFDKKGTRK
ncbi:hypothetical protein AVEN_25631-1 [Araneus ventricosus]|uniref:Uncharacterized protein n=1 Tax=Araneus ventricosus TaxID=182803 RepID=A0A4Y2BQC2_ARAVE|nr:hypothetical protein AVEN_25631-1 [Araneus ventricosus]